MEQLKKLILSLTVLLTSTIVYAQTQISGTVIDGRNYHWCYSYGKGNLERYNYRFRR